MNQFHTPTSEILADLSHIASTDLANRIRFQAPAVSVKSADADEGKQDEDLYCVEFEDFRNGGSGGKIWAKRVLLCVNRRLGKIRQVTLKDENVFQGVIRYGVGNQSQDVDFTGKYVVIVGGGAFAAEFTRTAIEKGAAGVVVLCRRRGTVMPYMIDYLFFIRPFDKNFAKDDRGSALTMQAWLKAFESCGVHPPECWNEGRFVPSGQAASTSDLWLVAHHYGLLSTRCSKHRCHSDHFTCRFTHTHLSPSDQTWHRCCSSPRWRGDRHWRKNQV